MTLTKQSKFKGAIRLSKLFPPVGNSSAGILEVQILPLAKEDEGILDKELWEVNCT